MQSIYNTKCMSHKLIRECQKNSQKLPGTPVNLLIYPSALQIKVHAGALTDVFHQFARYSLVGRVYAVSLYVVKVVESRVEADVPLLGRIDVEAHMHAAYETDGCRQCFDARFESLACGGTYIGCHVVAKFEHYNMLSHDLVVILWFVI